ncbi:MAG: AAA family ATPase [Candidatus Limnocylindrales bacterium]
MGSDITEWLEAHRIDVSTLAVDEIVGIGHVTAELRSIAGRLRHPEIVTAAGGELPRGLLLYGPPGTGKSTSARWLARAISADLPVYELAADELSATRIRALFRALSGVRSLLYIDEIDGIGL